MAVQRPLLTTCHCVWVLFADNTTMGGQGDVIPAQPDTGFRLDSSNCVWATCSCCFQYPPPSWGLCQAKLLCLDNCSPTLSLLGLCFFPYHHYSFFSDWSLGILSLRCMLLCVLCMCLQFQLSSPCRTHKFLDMLVGDLCLWERNSNLQDSESSSMLNTPASLLVVALGWPHAFSSPGDFGAAPAQHVQAFCALIAPISAACSWRRREEERTGGSICRLRNSIGWEQVSFYLPWQKGLFLPGVPYTPVFSCTPMVSMQFLPFPGLPRLIQEGWRLPRLTTLSLPSVCFDKHTLNQREETPSL